MHGFNPEFNNRPSSVPFLLCHISTNYQGDLLVHFCDLQNTLSVMFVARSESSTILHFVTE